MTRKFAPLTNRRNLLPFAARRDRYPSDRHLSFVHVDFPFPTSRGASRDRRSSELPEMVTPALIEGFIEQQPDAQEAVARLVYDRVWRVAKSLCSTDADAEDVTQHALLEILSSGASYNFRGGGSFERWVERIAIRQALETKKLEVRRQRCCQRLALTGLHLRNHPVQHGPATR